MSPLRVAEAVSALASGRNKIINGAMMIDQRNAGANVSTTTTASPVYTIDRWSYQCSTASKFTVQQNAGAVTPPAGFTSYLGITSTSSYSVGSSDYFAIQQRIEGFNTADLSWGSANAKAVTLSFQVYSSLTGTFGGSIRNDNGRYYLFSYTISSANTWTSISVTISGDTSGTWNTTNGASAQIWFALGVGSSLSGTAGSWSASNQIAPTGAVSVVGTNGATFYITGVQLEKGATATPFENRLYGTELALCQRYCFVETNDSSAYRWFAQGYNVSTTGASVARPLPVPMRSAPSITWTDITKFIVDQPATVSQACTSMTASFISPTYARFFPAVASGLTTNWPVALASNGDSLLRSITYSAEL
jgi:hypothetical protein